MFDVEINAGRYLAGDWGATTTISRKFGSGWEVGGYATLTDVPFDTFGEGSFDKAMSMLKKKKLIKYIKEKRCK